MSPLQVTVARTVGMARGLYATALAVAGFLALSGVLFAFGLEAAEGGRLPLPAIWAAAVSPVLPALAAFLAMDAWCEERRSGRADLLLTTAVRERDFVLGKTAGVWLLLMGAVGLSLVSAFAFLGVFAPAALAGVRAVAFLPALFALAVQGLLWCSASVALSAMFRHAAAAACSALVVLIALPRGIWAGLMAWSGGGRALLGEMPLDAHAVDFAMGMISLAALATYLILSLTLLFAATKCVASFRFVGRGALGLRVSTAVAVVLAAVLAVLSIQLASRLDFLVELPGGAASAGLSQRTRRVLSESAGDITVTCFLARSDSRFRSVGHLLRRLKAESAALGGARIELRFVDPRWDVGPAERLVRRGIGEECIVFEKGRRLVEVSFRDCGERACAAALRRLAVPSQRRIVYWTVGHGECAFDAYGAFGMSDIARELVREGYANAKLDLAAVPQVPADCALVLVAGAKDDFSHVELGRLDAYLRAGGRLLLLLGPGTAGGAASLLPSWGVRPAEQAIPGAKTLSGSDVIVSDFTDHSIGAPLRGSRIVLERPVTFAPSAAAEAVVGADRIGYSAVAEVGSVAVAAAVERGLGAGRDLALRPTRLVAVGDASFVMNGQLAARASANRDFFLNCAAYLSGSGSYGSSGVEADLFESGLDRSSRLRHVFWSAGAFPLAVFLLMAATVARRRRA